MIDDVEDVYDEIEVDAVEDQEMTFDDLIASLENPADFDPISDEEEESFEINLAEDISQGDESKIASRLLELLEIDSESNKMSRELYAEGLKRTGLSKEAPGGAQFEGAHRTVHPILAESAIDFQAKILKELLPPAGPVKMELQGKFTLDKLKKSRAKEKYLNDMMTKKMKEYIPSLEQLTAQVPLNGDQYLKFFWDNSLNRVRCMFIPSDKMLISSEASSFDSAFRKTEILSYTDADFKDQITAGYFREIEGLGEPGEETEVTESEPENISRRIIGMIDSEEIQDKQRHVFEIYTKMNWSLMGLPDFDPMVPEGKYAPYIIAIDSTSERILAIYRNWDPNTDDYEPLEYHVQYSFIPWRGPRAIGLVQLIGSLSGALTGTIRALLDSAHIQNAPTALKLRFGKASSKDYNIQIGQVNEFEAEAGVNDIRQMFMGLPFNPPSQTLYALMGDLDKLARGVVRTSFDQMADSSANVPVGTTLNRIEQGLSVFSSIFSRFHRAQQRTIDIICRLLYQNMPEEDYATPEDEHSKVTREDFASWTDLVPVSDPLIFSNSQRIAQAQMLVEQAEKTPDLYNRREAHRRFLEVANVPDIESVLPEPENQKDENPVTENVKIGMGAAAFALPDQDHLAHLETHLRWALSPAFGMNTAFARTAIPLMIEHMKHHILLHYAKVSVDMASEALGEPIADILDEHPVIMEGVSRILAVQSKETIAITEKQVAQAITAIAKLEEILASIQAPAPVDPVQAQLQIADKQQATELQKATIDATIKDRVSERQLLVEQEKLNQKQREMAVDDQNLDGDREIQELELQLKLKELDNKRFEIDLKEKELMVEAGQMIEVVEPQLSNTNMAIAGSMQSIADALNNLQKPKTVLRDAEGKIAGIV